MSRRVVIIGHTGKGDYGHGLDLAFVGVDGAEIVALADPDAAGRRRHAELTGAPAAYADYREMLAAEKPDIAVIATHEMSGHLEMVLASAAAGAHVYVEKPLATTLGEVDRMLDACDRAGVLLVMAHPWRGRPQIQQHAIPMIRGGEIGEPRWVRLYGHPAGRPTSHYGVFSGDAWMIDLYPHLFDFACQLFGAPLWCQSLITTDGRPATPDDLVEGPFGMGPTAGNGVAAQFQFQECTVEFVSYWASGTGWQHGESLPYGAEVHGTAGTLCLPGPTIEGSRPVPAPLHPLPRPDLGQPAPRARRCSAVAGAGARGGPPTPEVGECAPPHGALPARPARRPAAGVRAVHGQGRPRPGGDGDRRPVGAHPRRARPVPRHGGRQPVRELALGACRIWRVSGTTDRAPYGMARLGQ